MGLELESLVKNGGSLVSRELFWRQDIYELELERIDYIAQRTPLAIMLYRTPVLGVLMSSDLIQRLADFDNVVGMKQGSPIKGDTSRLRRQLRDDFIVADPNEESFLEELFNGAQVMWANYNYTLSGKNAT